MKTIISSLFILALLLTASCSRTQNRPHITVPTQFAVRSILTDNSGKEPDVLDLLVSRGEAWRIELADPALTTVKIWLGYNTNVVVASHVTTPEQAAKIFSMVSYYATRHKTSVDPELLFLGSKTLEQTLCWGYRSRDGVTLYFRQSDGLLIKEVSDRWTTDYTHLDFTDTDYNAALDTSKHTMRSSMLESILKPNTSLNPISGSRIQLPEKD